MILVSKEVSIKLDFSARDVYTGMHNQTVIAEINEKEVIIRSGGIRTEVYIHNATVPRLANAICACNSHIGAGDCVDVAKVIFGVLP